MNSGNLDSYPHPIVTWFIRVFSYVVCKLFWFMRFHGVENIPDKSEGSFLLAANHQTYLDPVWVCIPIRNTLRFMAWDGAFKWKFIGPLISYTGAFPVSLEVGGTLKAMKQSLRILRSGAVLTVFPEGERARADGIPRPFKQGVVRIASQAGVPILPVTIKGGNRVWPQGQRFPSIFKRVDIIYHPIMHFEGYDRDETREDADELTALLQEVIESGLDGERKIPAETK